MSMDTRILLADDHALVRRGVRLILDDSPGLCVVAEASDGAEAVTLARAEDVDLAILDVAMPRLTGLQAARAIASREPHPRMLMLSMYDNEQYFFEALKAGASGYVLNSVADQDLVEACHAAVRGESFLYPGVVSALARSYLDRIRRGESAAYHRLDQQGRRGCQADRGRPLLQGDRPTVDDQHQDRGTAPLQHLGEARHA